MILWRRLDVPGHDACRLTRHGDGWQVAGTAVFLDEIRDRHRPGGCRDGVSPSPASGSETQPETAGVDAGGPLPTLLAYSVICDAEWRATTGSVTGWSGEQLVDVRFERMREGWLMNGERATGVDDCLDLDFGFTPATNLFQIRRLNLSIGERGDAPAAWFDLSTAELVRLPQTYEHRSERTYGYDSPTASYSAELQMNDEGFARVYPGLWEQVTE